MHKGLADNHQLGATWQVSGGITLASGGGLAFFLGIDKRWAVLGMWSAWDACVEEGLEEFMLNCRFAHRALHVV